MKLKNNIRLLIIKEGYKSLQEFADKNDISYYVLRKLANDELNSIHIDFLVEFCEKIGCDVGDVFEIQKVS